MIPVSSAGSENASIILSPATDSGVEFSSKTASKEDLTDLDQVTPASTPTGEPAEEKSIESLAQHESQVNAIALKKFEQFLLLSIIILIPSGVYFNVLIWFVAVYYDANIGIFLECKCKMHISSAIIFSCHNIPYITHFFEQGIFALSFETSAP